MNTKRIVPALACWYLATAALAASSANAQGLNSSWTVTVNGQSIPVSPSGKFVIPNIASADQFGVGGPGTAPDFMSDNFLRLTGLGQISGQTMYLASTPFQLQQGQTKIFGAADFIISPFPFQVPESIELTLGDRIIEVGETTQVNVLANLPDGSTDDVTERIKWTIYRSAAPWIATIAENGLITAVAPGFSQITAVNEGSTSTSLLRVIPVVPRTTIIGFTMLSAGTALAGVNVQVVGTAFSTTSGPGGAFAIPDVTVGPGILEIECSVLLSGQMLEAEVVLENPVVGGFTDAGVVNMTAGPAFGASSASGAFGTKVTSHILLDTDIELRGWSFGLCHDPASVSINGAVQSPPMFTIQSGAPADFVVIDVLPGQGVTMGVIIDFLGVSTLAPTTAYEVLAASYDLIGPPGTTSQLCFCDTIGGGGAGPVMTVVTGLTGTAVSTDTYCGSININP
ncbi:MAG: hypothetical protein ACKVX7_18845 [Planctomycetota bacterium]